MDKIRLSLSLALLLLIMLTIPAIISYEAANSNLRKQVGELQKEVDILKTANLTAALGITEVPTKPQQIWGSKNNHLWITGWVFNSGGSMAVNASLNVLAYNESNSVLMNVTVPIISGREFSTATQDDLLPKVPYWLPGSLSLSELPPYCNILSQENATVSFSIFHGGSYPNSTRYEIKPIWKNSP